MPIPRRAAATGQIAMGAPATARRLAVPAIQVIAAKEQFKVVNRE